jgi:hypothetical protein
MDDTPEYDLPHPLAIRCEKCHRGDLTPRVMVDWGRWHGSPDTWAPMIEDHDGWHECPYCGNDDPNWEAPEEDV